ncbi:MAG: BatD family protein [Magnetococcales bacterium]|nr:BatD family protein [Magnetococcales bacterium]
MMVIRRWLVVMGFIWLTLAAPALGQEAQIRLEEGPHQTEVPIRIEIVATGFAETPEPEVRVAAPPWGQLELVGISPEVRSQVQIVNGQMSQWKSVRFIFHYRFIGDRTGTVTLGPFQVVQGTHEAFTTPVTLELGEIPVAGKDQRIVLSLPEEGIYVGQRVPVRLQWWIEESLAERLVGHEARVPLFEMTDRLAFEEVREDNQTNALVIHSPSGAKKFAADTSRGTWEGRSWLVLTVDRIMIALKEGDLDIPGTSVILEEGIRWQRTFFGEKTATQVRRLRVADSPRTLHVKPLPEEGRPRGFSGAIGQDFSLEVTAQRSVVQAGDPIHLTLTLKGEGTLTMAGLPPLDRADGGLPVGDFRVPEGHVAGIVTDGVKKFEMTVRVLHEGVREIPPLAFSWFDPKSGRYETTHSRPIALSVSPARRVSAADVERGGRTEGEHPDRLPESATDAVPATVPEQRHETPTVTPETPPGSTSVKEDATAANGKGLNTETSPWTGADFAIERRVAVLQGKTPTDRILQGVWIGGYGGGVVCLGYALWRWRRNREDPIKARRRAMLRPLALEVTHGKTPKALADALRRMAMVATDFSRPELDSLLEALDNLAYAPGTGEKDIPSALKSRAVAFAKRLMDAAS